MLIERGELSFHCTLSDIFTDFPVYGKQITVHHLLQHTSGLISYESIIPETASEQVLDRDVLRMTTGQDSTYFSPGTSYQHSNSGYAVLAMVVKKISGRTFAQFLKKNIFDPLGMKTLLHSREEFPRLLIVHTDIPKKTAHLLSQTKA